jgi:hypothetical protein
MVIPGGGGQRQPNYVRLEQFCCGHLKQGLPNPEPCRANGGVPSRLQTRYSPRGPMIGACGADDVAAYGEKIRKLRFQMINDNLKTGNPGLVV